MSDAEGGPGTRPCPQCGKLASGNFCQHCGASLGGRFCNQCGTELSPGSKFCSQCGTPVGSAPPAPSRTESPPPAPGRAPSPAPAAYRAAGLAPGRGPVSGSQLPWWIAGGAMLAMILVIGYFMVRGASPAGQSGGSAQAGNPAAGASAINLAAMTPIQAADSLFDDVMRHLAAGDTAWAMRFQPMAVSAYQRAEPLDPGGLFDMSLLQRMTDPDSALATAKRILVTDPDHVLGLAAAAEAAADLGDSTQAAKYYRHLLEVYDTQVGKQKPAYITHKPLMSIVKAQAQEFVTGRKKK